MPNTGFKFRFQKILDLRENQQKMIELELARNEKKIRDKKKLRESIHSAKLKAMDQQRRATLEGDWHLRLSCSQYLGFLNERIRLVNAELEDLRKERESIRIRLQKVAKAYKALENYRDRQAMAFMDEVERLEEKVAEVHTTNSRAVSRGNI